jgi:porin
MAMNTQRKQNLHAVAFVCAVAFTGTTTLAGSLMQPAPSTSHSIFERETLTDDWFGADPALRDHGINLSGSLTQFYQGLASGTGSHAWQDGGKGDLFLRLDGAKLGLWERI